jgi:hypothetical protein
MNGNKHTISNDRPNTSEKDRCRACAQSTQERCPKRRFRGSNYCWYHQDRMPILVALALGVLTSLGIPKAWDAVFPPRALQEIEDNTRPIPSIARALRKPEITCKIDEQDFLNSTLAVGWRGDGLSQTFWIENVGDTSAGRTDVFVYVKYKEEHPLLWSAWDPDENLLCELAANDDPRCETKFFVNYVEEFHARRKFDFRFEHSLNITTMLEIPAMLKVHYNGPKPLEIPFTMKLIPRREQQVKNKAGAERP